MEHVFEVPPEHDRWRADKAVHAFHSEISRSQIQRLFEKGLVWREEVALAKSDKVYVGDTLSFSIPPPVPLELRPVDIPLEVLYEDEHLIAINKAPGMVVHPGAGTGEDTLVHALLHHCHGELSGIGGVERPGIVHRLDRETSGVIVAAKSDLAFQGLSKAFSERLAKKTYLAIVAGRPRFLAGTINEPIGRHPVHRQRMAVRNGGREALSEWEIEADLGPALTLLRVRIHTGRTHQIRVHLAHIGHPIAGDPTYGWKEHTWPLPEPCSRVMLHALRLKLDHPATGEPLRFDAPLPADIEGIIDTLGEEFSSEAESEIIE